jgi:uncharacterized delta-60 repeat protein
VALSAVWSLAPAAWAGAGDLDPSFSGDGKLVTDFDVGGASGVALQSDGKLVVVGDSGGDFALARYDPDGLLDSTFAGDGTLTTDFGRDFEGASDVALRSDGKIVVVGGGGPGDDFALARYNPDGSLDSTFAGDGTLTTDFGDVDEASGVVLQGDGKVVAAGTIGAPGSTDFALARYEPDGSLDPSFSGDGKQTADFSATDRAAAVALQADGKLVVPGVAGGMSGSRFALARFDASGQLDASFAGGEREPMFGTRKFEADQDFAADVALQADGKIVAAGGASARLAGRLGFALARFNGDGSLDPSFSGDGKLLTDFGGNASASGVAVQGDGRIVAVGSSFPFAGDQDFALARYKRNGSLDAREVTDFGGEDDASDVALQGDGRIVVAGSTQGSGGDGVLVRGFALARYRTLTLDPPRLALLLSGRPRLGVLAGHGLGFRLRTSERVQFTASLEISRQLARRLRLAQGLRAGERRPVVIGRSPTRRVGPGAARVRIKLSRAARQRIGGARRVRATLRVRASDAEGNTRTASRRLRFQR